MFRTHTACGLGAENWQAWKDKHAAMQEYVIQCFIYCAQRSPSLSARQRRKVGGVFAFFLLFLMDITIGHPSAMIGNATATQGNHADLRKGVSRKNHHRIPATRSRAISMTMVHFPVMLACSNSFIISLCERCRSA
jgi:hypothetical protein